MLNSRQKDQGIFQYFPCLLSKKSRASYYDYHTLGFLTVLRRKQVTQIHEICYAGYNVRKKEIEMNAAGSVR